MDHHSRIDAVKQHLQEEEFSGFVATGSADAQYLSGFQAYADADTRTRYPAVVVPQEGEAVLLVGGLDREQAHEISDIPVRTPEESFTTLIAEIIGGGEVLVEGSVTVEFYDNLSDDLELTVDDVLSRLRQTKDGEEVAEIRSAYEVTQRVLDAVKDTLHGRSEKDVVAELEYRMRQAGAERASFPSIVASGTHSSRPHHTPTGETVEEGPVLFDIGAQVNGYAADLSRTVFLEEPPMYFRDGYRAVLKAQEAAETVLRAGADVGEVDEAARTVLEEEGYDRKFPHATGHGIGLSVHENPKISKNGEDTLEAGMIVTLEPGIYIEGEFGIRIEDAYVIENNGAERITSSSRDVEDAII